MKKERERNGVSTTGPTRVEAEIDLDRALDALNEAKLSLVHLSNWKVQRAEGALEVAEAGVRRAKMAVRDAAVEEARHG